MIVHVGCWGCFIEGCLGSVVVRVGGRVLGEARVISIQFGVGMRHFRFYTAVMFQSNNLAC